MKTPNTPSSDPLLIPDPLLIQIDSLRDSRMSKVIETLRIMVSYVIERNSQIFIWVLSLGKSS